MLFNSPLFIFCFLPATLLLFHLGARHSPRRALAVLFACSLFFYGWWRPPYLVLLGFSIVVNFLLGKSLARRDRSTGRWLLIFGVVLNLGLLGYYKYAEFLATNFTRFAGWGIELDPILLPLAISFFTFQQIAYLVDTYQGKTEESDFLRYGIFVSFFPQLIAGPIVHHGEMLPQFARADAFRVNPNRIALGITTFVIGLFKKVVVADTLAAYATPVFAAADAGSPISVLDAWCGALAYTFQLYFDFSGYSDMAIGLGLLFGIQLPLNFFSPYRSTNIIEFWRRWHMTLSRFLRDYLYIPLGGNRHGRARRYLNLLITMLLGGLWHGAGWSFVLWGLLHGLYLVANHAWHSLRRRVGKADSLGLPGSLVGGTVTFGAVVFAWVLFRAETLGGAILVLQGMAGLSPEVRSLHFQGPLELAWIIVAAITCFSLPNTSQLMGLLDGGHGLADQFTEENRGLRWEPNLSHAALAAALTLAALFGLNRVSEFLYFNF